MTKARKEYIGDGVYAEYDGWTLILTAEDGVHATNRIVLEHDVYAGLCAFVRRSDETIQKQMLGDEEAPNA